MKRIYLDVTLCARFQGQSPVGIVRVEAEFIKYLAANHDIIRDQGYDIRMCQVVGDSYCEIAPGKLYAKIAKLSVRTNKDVIKISGAHKPSAPILDLGPIQPRTIFFVCARAILRWVPAKKSESLRIGYYGLGIFFGALRDFLRLHPTKTPQVADAGTAQTVVLQSHHPFNDGDVLVTLGNPYAYKADKISSQIMQRVAIKKITCLHDIIPLTRPDLTQPGLYLIYSEFTRFLALKTDVVVCVSRQTATDFVTWSQGQGWDIKPKVETIFLGCDMRVDTPIRPEIAGFDFDSEFVLCVSTLEVRKNHLWLLEIWSALLRDDRSILPLVLVGGKGWLSDDLLQRIAQFDEAYPGVIFWCKNITDQQLAWLYTNCRFSVYPSLYEGWGLPITESLQYGKPVIANDAGSMREAGAGIAQLVELNNFGAWVASVKSHMFDDEYLAGQSAIIADQFKPRYWSQWAQQTWDLIVDTTKRDG